MSISKALDVTQTMLNGRKVYIAKGVVHKIDGRVVTREEHDQAIKEVLALER